MEFRYELVEEETRGFFELYVDDNEKRLGLMSFSRAGDRLWIIDHTEVQPELSGSGAGAALVRHGVEVARARGVKIIPLCPFAKSQFERHPEFADVLN